jgi:membrane associated rhomboid family serine protease
MPAVPLLNRVLSGVAALVPDGLQNEDTRLKSNRRLFNSPPVVIGTVLVLVAAHAARMLFEADWDKLALIPVRIPSQWWSLITYAFLHGDWVHLGLNSLWLLVFGTPVARWFGSLNFIVISTFSAIGGAIAMVITDPGGTIPVIGASGAVSGLMAAAIPVMYGRFGRPLLPREFLHDRRALIFIVIWLFITLVTGSHALIGEEGVRVAWEAHLGGFFAGLLSYIVLIGRTMRQRLPDGGKP